MGIRSNVPSVVDEMSCVFARCRHFVSSGLTWAVVLSLIVVDMHGLFLPMLYGSGLSSRVVDAVRAGVRWLAGITLGVQLRSISGYVDTLIGSVVYLYRYVI